MIRFEESKRDNALILKLSGRLDANTSGTLEDRFTELLDSQEKNYIVDMSEVDYISSIGLRVLLVLAKKAKKNMDQIVLCNLQKQVHEVFEIAGFTTIFTICKDEEEALQEL